MSSWPVKNFSWSKYHSFVFFAGIIGLINLWMIFIWVPTERSMGLVQRLFYIHVPTVWVGFIAFGFVALASALYLFEREIKWDRRASTAAEIGLVLLSVSMATGAMWAKPVWGTWWTWDPKLTSVFVLWLIFIGYLMVRVYATSSRQAATWSSIVGIIGFANVPIVYLASMWWRSLHPELVTGPLSESGSLDPDMRTVLYFSTFVFAVLFVCLTQVRLLIKNSEEEFGIYRKELSG